MRHCHCQPRRTATFSPLTSLLTEHTSPELLFMETKWSSLVSYGMSVKALRDFLPVDEKLNPDTVRNDTLKVAQRCEADQEVPRGFRRLPSVPEKRSGPVYLLLQHRGSPHRPTSSGARLQAACTFPLPVLNPHFCRPRKRVPDPRSRSAF